MELTEQEKEVIFQALYMAAVEGFDEAGDLLDRLKAMESLDEHTG